MVFIRVITSLICIIPAKGGQARLLILLMEHP